MNIASAWEKGFTGQGVVVTILDDGIDHDHPDIKRNYVSTHDLYIIVITIATDKARFSSEKMLISFLFLHENICCGYSLEAPRQGASNEYPQHMFLCRNKKNIIWIPPLICSYDSPTIDNSEFLTLIMLNKLRYHAHFLLSANQTT